MGKLIYSAITSLDGYVADERGEFRWAAPDDEVFAFVNDLERTVGTYLYGRRMYDVMAVWESIDLAGQPAVMSDFAQLWRAAEKVVYSRSLDSVSTPRTRLERTFDGAQVRRLKEQSQSDITVGGPGLAAEAIRAGLVDEYHLLLNPIVVGGGTAALPAHTTLGLDLVDQRRFAGGVVHLHYRTRT